MKVQQDVPFSVKEVSAKWLSDGLIEAGLLESGSVVDIELNSVGEQVGFNGEVVIITPKYSEPSETAPTSLVLKIPTASKNRILGQTMGLYEKEIRFYRDLQGSLKIRAPEHYYSALDEADDPDVILERMRGMNRLPIWVIRGLMVLVTKFVSGNPRKYALLIEDLSAYRMGDQVAGCTDEEMRNIVVTMARLHAQFWADEKLSKMSWISPYAVTSRFSQMRYLKVLKHYLAEEGVGLNSQQRDLLTWLRDNGVELLEDYGDLMPTLLHGDFRLDNICFDDAKNEVVLFDWQTMQVGPGASDLAYFISATLPMDADEALVNELIDVYHTEITRQGVTIDREQLRGQYEVGMVCMLHRMIPTVYDDQMDLDAERGLPLLKAWISRIYARLAHCDLDTIKGNAIG